MSHEAVYGYWNMDKPQEPGYTREMVAMDAKNNLLDKCSVDALDALPYEGVDTFYKALLRNVERIPNNEFLGGRAGDKFEFWTFREVAELSEHLANGIMAFNLSPEVEAEDKVWRFVGL